MEIRYIVMGVRTVNGVSTIVYLCRNNEDRINPYRWTEVVKHCKLWPGKSGAEVYAHGYHGGRDFAPEEKTIRVQEVVYTPPQDATIELDGVLVRHNGDM